MKKMLCAVLAMALSACLLFSGCGWGGAAVPKSSLQHPRLAFRERGRRETA